MTLELRHVSVDYGSTRAVSSVSLTLQQGSILALVGPSGCGKSTLLHAVAGLVPLAGGSVHWRDENLGGTPTERRDIGFMFQDHALFTHRSVADNIAFGLAMRRVKPSEKSSRIKEMLALVGLEGFGPRSVESLSGGEAQRVALARALAPRPRLLLLDEPLASLDRSRRDQLNTELADLLSSLAQTAIYVTHDQHEAFAIADHIGVMAAGELVRLDEPAKVWRDPRTEFVARFVGHNTIVERDGQRFAVRGDAVRIRPTRAQGLEPRAPSADSGASVVSVSGVVDGCRFHGDRYLVSAIDTDGLSWSGWSETPFQIAESVSILINEDRLAPLD